MKRYLNFTGYGGGEVYKPKVLLIRTAGTNCDKETEFAFNQAGGEVDNIHIETLKQKPSLVLKYQIICIPGGFSYGDVISAGKILAFEIKRFLAENLHEFMEKRDGLILGICNGFQVLIKSGILPYRDYNQKFSLVSNDSGRFEDRWIYLKVEGNSIWLKNLPEIITLPVAHAEGKFTGTEDDIMTLEENRQVSLRYVSPEGKEPEYPYNPNGSINNIAGITDPTGKILGLMPHPERFIFSHQAPDWLYKKDILPYGRIIFNTAIEYFK